MILIRFLVLIRGALTPAPKMEDPVIMMPQAAPMTENEMAIAMPRVPHIYGDVSVKYAAVSILEPLPVINMTNQIVDKMVKKIPVNQLHPQHDGIGMMNESPC